MANLFQGFPRAVLLSGPHGHKRPLRPTTTTTAAISVTETRSRHIAQWDHKRAVCGNCKHIFLKAQSKVAGFCSMDCKANAVYVANIRAKITAVASGTDSTDALEQASCVQTFAAFGLEDRVDNEFCSVRETAVSARH